MWDHPGSGIEPGSPALAGKFFTTELPGKPRLLAFWRLLSHLTSALWPPNVRLIGMRVQIFSPIPLAAFLFCWLFCYSKLFTWCSCICLFLILLFQLWVSSSKTRCQDPHQEACSLLFSRFMISVLIFVFIHFELIFVSSVRNGSSFILLHVNIQFSQH